MSKTSDEGWLRRQQAVPLAFRNWLKRNKQRFIGIISANERPRTDSCRTPLLAARQAALAYCLVCLHCLSELKMLNFPLVTQSAFTSKSRKIATTQNIPAYTLKACQWKIVSIVRKTNILQNCSWGYFWKFYLGNYSAK